MNSTWMLGQSIINGLLIGGTYAMIAVGLTIIFGVMKVINFAQGEFLTVGMYVTWTLCTYLGMNIYATLVPVAIIMLVIGFGVFRITINPILGRQQTSFVVLTMGLAYVVISVVQLIFGTVYLTVPSTIKDSGLKIGSFSVLLPRLIACGVMGVVVLILNFFLKKTDLGRALRATAENTEVATMMGINTKLAFAFAFALGIMFAGISGLLLTPLYYVYPSVGSSFKTIAMVVVVLGGLGSVGGAVLGGFIAGIVEALIGSYISFDLAPAGIFVILILVLLFKPEGMFGKRVRRA